MTDYKGNDRLLFGMIFGIATYWLFAGAITAGVPPLTGDLGISSSVVNSAVSITALICGVSIMPATLALINAYYPGEARPRALSFWSLASWGGSGVANLFGGAVVSLLGWAGAGYFGLPFHLH